MFNVLAFLGLPYGAEWIMIGLLALLIFGSRLPQIARNLGKSIIEFKKGVKDSENEIRKALDEADKAGDKKPPENQQQSGD